MPPQLALLFVGAAGRALAACGDCLDPRTVPGCSVPAVADCVCGVDPFCCTFAWGAGCVDEVARFGCARLCSPPPAPSGAPAPASTALSAGWVFSFVVIIGIMLYCCCGILYNTLAAGSDNPLPHLEWWNAVARSALDGCWYSAAAVKKLLCGARLADRQPLTTASVR